MQLTDRRLPYIVLDAEEGSDPIRQVGPQGDSGTGLSRDRSFEQGLRFCGRIKQEHAKLSPP